MQPCGGQEHRQRPRWLKNSRHFLPSTVTTATPPKPADGNQPAEPDTLRSGPDTESQRLPSIAGPPPLLLWCSLPPERLLQHQGRRYPQLGTYSPSGALLMFWRKGLQCTLHSLPLYTPFEGLPLQLRLCSVLSLDVRLVPCPRHVGVRLSAVMFGAVSRAWDL